MLTSHVPSVIRFGCLVGVAVTASFVASQTILPAFVYVFRPRFLVQSQPEPHLALDGREPHATKVEHRDPSH